MLLYTWSLRWLNVLPSSMTRAPLWLVQKWMDALSLGVVFDTTQGVSRRYARSPQILVSAKCRDPSAGLRMVPRGDENSGRWAQTAISFYLYHIFGCALVLE